MVRVALTSAGPDARISLQDGRPHGFPGPTERVYQVESWCNDKFIERLLDDDWGTVKLSNVRFFDIATQTIFLYLYAQ